MEKCLIFLLVGVNLVRAFNFFTFQEEICHPDHFLKTTINYIPYDIGYFKEEYGLICENFILKQEDIEYMKKNRLIVGYQKNIFMKNCEIPYFNEDLISIFPHIKGIYFENCKVTLADSNPGSSVAISEDFVYLGFHQSRILNNENSSGLQKFKRLNLFLQETLLETPYIDEHFLPKHGKGFTFVMDKTNIKGFQNNVLPDRSNYIKTFACSSCELENFDFIKKENSFYKTLGTLVLSGNKISIPVLKQEHFKGHTYLRCLDLSNNPKISSINYMAFEGTSIKFLNMSNVKLQHLEKLGSRHLQTIDFSSNIISEIPNKVFEDLFILKSLNLSNNEISDFSKNIFKDLENLEELNLQSNDFKSIPTESLEKLNSLKILNLSENKIEKSLERKDFMMLNNLEILDLTRNNISEIKYSTFNDTFLRILEMSTVKLRSLDKLGSQHLEIINFSNNEISLIPVNTFEDLINLKDLDLSYNQITFIDEISFRDLEKIEKINLKYNVLHEISDDAFKNHINLKILDLTCNFLTSFEIEKLNSVSELNLSENDISDAMYKDLKDRFPKILQISEVKYFTCINHKQTYFNFLNMSNQGLNRLEKFLDFKYTYIDLSHNLITNIPKDSLENVSFLKILDLSHNKIAKIDEKAFKNLKNLLELNLKYNFLRSISSDTLFGLHSLQKLDLSYNILSNVNGLELSYKIEEQKSQQNFLKTASFKGIFPNYLQHLSLSNNPLLFVGKSSFDNLRNLISLDLSNTNHSQIYFNEECLRMLEFLKNLNMSSNYMSSIDDIFLPTSLKSLDLSFNRISKISDTHLEVFKNLEFLSLANNGLETIKDSVLKVIFDIEIIDLSGNKFKIY